MEELREAAIAYYNNGSNDLRMVAWNFFKSMDVNGDGRVSLIEFVEFLRQRGYHWISPNLFTELDRNGDGCLDFGEVLTMYYMVKTRSVCCRECRAILKGLYFTCVVCFDCGGDAYDLCSTCYRWRTFSHGHNCFLDSYVLLRSKRGTSNGATNLNLVSKYVDSELSLPDMFPEFPSFRYQPSTIPPIILSAQPSIPQPLVVAPVGQPAKIRWLEAFKALEMVFAIGGLASVGCTIM